MKSSQKATFDQILKNASVLNLRKLVQKTELAASLARLYPQCGQQLFKIERCTRAQVEAIGGLRFGSAAAMD